RRIEKLLQPLETAKGAITSQMRDLEVLQNAAIFGSLNRANRSVVLRDALSEITAGVGQCWKSKRVLGATRTGLAPAREPPGKNADRYKPVDVGTIFYNPMRVLIGSIAFVDEDDHPGITSPDYVVLKGREGVIDSRWFYYWLRSPLGKRFIQ